MAAGEGHAVFRVAIALGTRDRNAQHNMESRGSLLHRRNESPVRRGGSLASGRSCHSDQVSLFYRQCLHSLLPEPDAAAVLPEWEPVDRPALVAKSLQDRRKQPLARYSLAFCVAARHGSVLPVLAAALPGVQHALLSVFSYLPVLTRPFSSSRPA